MYDRICVIRPLIIQLDLFFVYKNLTTYKILVIQHSKEECYRLQNKSFQQMQTIIYLYCICYFSPYMFRALTDSLSGVSWAACLCYNLVHAVLLSVRASADARTDNSTTCNKWWHKQAAQDTPDDGAVRARNM
jgi:hypothetical protein